MNIEQPWVNLKPMVCDDVPEKKQESFTRRASLDNADFSLIKLLSFVQKDDN